MSTSESQEQPASSSADTITINIKAPSDSKLSLSISLSKTVLDLKKLISESTNPKVEAENQRLIYSGRVLKDDSVLSEYKIQSGHSIHMVKGAPRATNPTPATQQIPSNLNAGQQIAGNPLAPLLNATNQIPGFNPFADLGINTNDPNMAMNMMNNPQVLQSAARLLEDPAMVDQMIASDPRLQTMGPQVREMLRSPMFRQMLTNSELMRSMQGAMRGGGAGGGNPFGDFGMPGAGTTGGGPTDPIAAALGAQTAAGATPGGNAVPPAGGLPGMDPLAFMNSPLGQMAMQQMNNPGGGMMGGMGFPMAPPQPADPRPAEERFEVQLGQLQAMGFTDSRQNVTALMASGGSVEAAIEYILSGN
ncbi:hypothetical protein MJO29_008228 [Puccinia striiformis f. sp. tritici]|uniref:Ubiquilin n=2 Tax=Puccinia striiformis TaxID=27350 RepID=A0A0L0V391_9BASI|nr:hypothetical protein MJO29_008228 [Puccinia striiformis f. sp. tritici]KNE93763.1 hypothetical protein PSTG_12866 [Puccinia striiformis f. sp. tritici PST-78]